MWNNFIAFFEQSSECDDIAVGYLLILRKVTMNRSLTITCLLLLCWFTPAIFATDMLYVSMTNSTIVRYDISLTDATAVQNSSQVFASTPNPKGLAFDTSGNFYVANYGNSLISKFDNAGVFQYSWSTGSTSPHFLAIRSIPVPEASTYTLGLLPWVFWHLPPGDAIKQFSLK